MVSKALVEPVAPIGLSLIMKARGLEDKDIARVLNAIEAIDGLRAPIYQGRASRALKS